MTEFSKDTLLAITGLAATEQDPIENADGSKTVIVPTGYQLQTIQPPERKLWRVHQNIVLHDANSFIDYVNQHKTSATRIFAEPGFIASDKQGVIQAVIDYHEAIESEPSKPDYCAHIATFKPRYSDEWKTWEGVCAEPVDQRELAEFIEENRKDIVTPDAAVLMDIIRTFKASKKVEFDSVTYTNDGSVQIGYSEEVQQRQNVGGMTKVPEKIKVGIPVYFRDEIYGMELFVRFRVAPGKVIFDLKRDRADVIENDAFKRLLALIADATSIGPFTGRRS
jgi:uncharacterized protein YfdQ (DUF2303 family)